MKLPLIILSLIAASNTYADCDSKMSDQSLVTEVTKLRSDLQTNPRLTQVTKIISCDEMIAERLFQKSKVPENGSCDSGFPVHDGALFSYKEKMKDAIYCGNVSISGICMCKLGDEDSFSVLFRTEAGEAEALDYLKALDKLNYNFIYNSTAEAFQRMGGDGELDQRTIENLPAIVGGLCTKFRFPTSRKKIGAAIDRLLVKLAEENVKFLTDAEVKKLSGEEEDSADGPSVLAPLESLLPRTKALIKKTIQTVSETRKAKCL